MRGLEQFKFRWKSIGIAATAMGVLGTTAAVILGTTFPVHATITRSDLAEVGVTGRPDASLPLNLPLKGEDGTAKPVNDWLGTAPSIWVLADYTCKTLCGPVISIVSDALSHSALRPGADFRLIVVGLDPKDTADDAAKMKQAQVGDGGSAAYFLRGDAGAIAELTRALGFRSAYDRDHDQFAHPAAAFVIRPDGRLSRVLSGLDVDSATIRLAVVSAGEGVVGTWTDHIRLLCYGYDPATGTYTVAIGRILASAAGFTLAVLILLIGFLLRSERAARRIGINAPRFGARSRTPTTE
jgi:protein SCO1/2